MPISNFTQSVIEIIRKIPKGKVLTYGQIAVLAGNPRGARQVSWILHSSSKKYNLPWHRVINAKGKIALKSMDDRFSQKIMLEEEGIEFEKDFKIDLEQFLWHPNNFNLKK